LLGALRAVSSLLESFVKAISPAPRSVAPTVTAGEGGSAELYGSGYVKNTERSGALQGKRRFITYSEMLANTSMVAAGTRYFLNISSKASWIAQPAMDQDGKPLPGAEAIAESVNLMMSDMSTPWYRVVRRAAMYRFLGFSVQEWTAKKRDDGQIGMKDVENRPQVSIERWDVDPSGTVQGVTQRLARGGEIYLPRNKIIHLVDDALNDSPEGLGVLRHAVRIAQRLDAYEQLEELAFETDLRGIPIGRAPLKSLRELEAAGKINKAESNRLMQPLRNFINNHIRNRELGIMLDSETYVTQDEKNAPSQVKAWDLELLQGSATGQDAVAIAINRLNYELARVLGTEHLLLGSDGTGSLALGNVKAEDFYMQVQSCLSEMTEAYTRDFIGPLGLLNGWDQKLLPKFKVDSVQPKDAARIAITLKDMATAGAVLGPDDPAIMEMRDLLGLARPSQESIDRALEDATLAGQKTSAEIDATSAKAKATLNPPKQNPDKQVKPGERQASSKGTK
jgi:hypothetical protein